MNLKLAAAALLTATAFSTGFTERRGPLFDGLQFSRVETDRDGGLIKVLPASDGILRVWVPLGEFSPLLVNATRVELGDDAPAAVARALARRRIADPNADGAAGLVRLRRRLEEVRLRAIYGPDELLEAYLNLSSYGPGIQGAGAASLVYFGKNPDQLTLTEAAELSVLPDHPIRATLSGRDNAEDREARQKALKRLKRRLPRRG